jgi:predicted nicotinamide N-methyase
MLQNATIQNFVIGNTAVQLFVPASTTQLQHVHSPYWGKVWPAALGLCNFLYDNVHYIKNKSVTELAAGLGLPSIFAATYAATVFCSDIEPAAIEFVQQSVLQSKLTNMQCAVAGWDDITTNKTPEVLLLSDINYEPEAFESLLKVIHRYLQLHCTIILSTPQRLMAKPFIEKLLPHCINQKEIPIAAAGGTLVSVFVLQHTQ